MIQLKSDAEIDAMKASGKLAWEVLNEIGKHVRAGVSTAELDEICHAFITARGAIPAPLNYRGFPKSVCTSVNEVVCHGIPSQRVRLRPGDIINIDVTTILDGFHGDTSRMFWVGEPPAEARRLINTTRECLELGIKAVRLGGRVGDIGAAIEAHATGHGYSVVREFVGHGIGRRFHEDPQIPHVGEAGTGERLREGMVFTIEPMLNQGHWKTKVKRDGWTAVTVDRKLSAQFEHTLAIKSNGRVIVLTDPERWD